MGGSTEAVWRQYGGFDTRHYLALFTLFLPLPHILRDKFNTDKLEDLEFSLCIAPVATEVAAEADLKRAGLGSGTTAASGSRRSGASLSGDTADDLPSGGGDVPPGQSFTAKSALMLWLWLEQQCAGCVRGAHRVWSVDIVRD